MEKELLLIQKRIADESMAQEKERKEVLYKKSTYVVNLVSAIVGIFSLISIFGVFRNVYDSCWTKLLVVVVFILLILSVILAVLSSIVMKGKAFPTSETTSLDFEKIESEDEGLQYEIKCISIYTQELDSVNTNRAKCLKWSYVFFIIALALLSITSLIIIWN